ncbi:ATP-binding protein [Fulvivirga ligni]|uniref:ATP-binding protein n=1 Tax=Fulvivirga ligni TaxID=2904246 RepID=UPI001F380684|nr:ATP-binding protein [Fulvivirga ligni]UII19657.1 ATP-binding protein [Fulvivirga ligni]
MADSTFIKEALKRCEDEKIHLIGSIQSHGYLVGVNRHDYIIKYVSENIELLFKGELLGEKIDIIDGQINTSVSGNTLVELLNTQVRTENFDGYNPYSITLNGVPYNLITHTISDLIVLEFEPETNDSKGLEINSFLGDVLIHLNVSNKTLKEIFAVASIKLKDLLGMDRVMIYQFDDDWSGEVIAEAKESDLEPYLGLHFPATDIPRQARILYTKNKTRHIASTLSEPVHILSKSNKPLDQSFCQLRSVSPVHIEYLKNMGVTASFSISLLCHGKLWGLVSCHHYSPKFLDYNTRKASEIISHYLSNIVELKSDKDLAEQRDKYEHVVQTLETQIREDWNLKSGLTSHNTNLLSLNRAQGAALFIQDEITVIGETPSENDVKAIIDAFFNSDIQEDVFHTTSLAHLYPFTEKMKDVASGLMIVVISKELKECLLWFKPEKIQNVSWAGKPDKVLTTSDEGVVSLSPRKSFEKWETTVSNTSESWRPYEVEAAKVVKEKIETYLRLKSNEVRRLNEKLTLAYDELNTFSYTLSHDLRTPLNNIHGYLELYLEEEGLDVADNFYLQKVMSNTELMQKMIKEVMSYAQVTQAEVEFTDVNVHEVIEEIQAQLHKESPNCVIQNELSPDLIIQGNAVMLFQILFNLVENALKYRDKNKECYVKVFSEQNEEKIDLYIEDNGVGIDPKDLNNIFRLFKRVNRDPAIQGSGVGLSIVKKLISKHNGTIEVTSEVGKGSIFKITFNKVQ